MANFEHKLNTGSLFKNESDNDKAPQYTGQANIDGKVKKLSVWVNKIQTGDNAGKSYMSIKIDEPYVAPASDAVKVTKVAQADDDLPF